MDIQEATHSFDSWLATQLTIKADDLEVKHKEMRKDEFEFFRATFYRWTGIFPKLCPELAAAPEGLIVGDLHVENFGTWRDAEGRLAWGVNDFDEAYPLPYTNDLVRLATSAFLAIKSSHLSVSVEEAASSILAGYTEALDHGGRPFVLAESHQVLRDLAFPRLKEPHKYWKKMAQLGELADPVPAKVTKLLQSILPDPALPVRIVWRPAGLGSRGRQRITAIAQYRGGYIAREAKELCSSACTWASGSEPEKVHAAKAVKDAIRCADPYVKFEGAWIGRRLAPDCSRIELSSVPKAVEQDRLMWSMGWETANVHLGSIPAKKLLADLATRHKHWLTGAAEAMLKAVHKDWKDWKAK